MHLGRILPDSAVALFGATSLLFSLVLSYLLAILRIMNSFNLVITFFGLFTETVSMKALVVSSMDKRKKEAYDLARLGIRNDITSALTWHVLAILYRSDQCYVEAMRCMHQALFLKPGDRQILRELSGIQVQARDYVGLYNTRKLILTTEPKLETNWMSFAVAAHLRGDYNGCVNTIDNFEEMRDKQRVEDRERRAAAAASTGKTPDPVDADKPDPFEQSELLMYRNTVIQEKGDLKAALENLEAIEPRVTDKQAWKETKAGLFLRLEQWEQAREMFSTLVATNADHRDYHIGLQKSLLHINAADFAADKATLTAEQSEKLLKCYDDLRSQFPKAALVQIFPLFFYKDTQLAAFELTFAHYARAQLEKGVPSLWNTVKPLYSNSTKASALQEIALRWLKNLQTVSKFEAADQKTQPPSTELWLQLFIAQHFNKLLQHNTALEHIEAAIKHTPTCLDAYLFKARILKHAGAPKQAADLVNKTREMDLADRYLNNKATLYLLRAGQIDDAQKLINVFTKIEPDTYNNIFEMQVSWYEQAEGEAWIAKGDFGRALKRFTDIEAHFKDFVEDQVDFHTYNIRKSILRNYINLLRFEDKIYGHEHFVRAAQSIVQTNLAILDAPSKAQLDDVETAGMSDEDKKAYLAKKKRQANKEKARAGSEKEKLPYKKCYGPRYDWDPEGEKLAKAASLETCAKYVAVLQQFAPNSLRTQLLSGEVYIRREKPLLALRSLRRALKYAPEGVSDAGVHAILVKFVNFFHARALTLNAVVKEVVEADLKEILAVASLPTAAELNSKFLTSRGAADFTARLSSVKVAVTVLGEKAETFKSQLLNFSGVSGYPLSSLLEAYTFVQHNLPKADADSFKEAAHKAFPHIETFAPAVAAASPAADAAADAGEDPSVEPSK